MLMSCQSTIHRHRHNSSHAVWLYTHFASSSHYSKLLFSFMLASLTCKQILNVTPGLRIQVLQASALISASSRAKDTVAQIVVCKAAPG